MAKGGLLESLGHDRASVVTFLPKARVAAKLIRVDSSGPTTS